MSPTSLRYYTLEVHHPTRIGKFFEDTMHGNMRYDAVPPPLPRRLSTTSHHNPQPQTADHDLRGHWIGSTIFGLLWFAIGCHVGHRQRGGDDARTTRPHWVLAGKDLSASLFARYTPGSTWPQAP
eukprot:3266325-Pyramimonas_sp.AAC.1